MFCTTHSQPLTPGTLARPGVSMVFTEPPPPEPSIIRTTGTRYWLAYRSMKLDFSLIVASAEPPRTVKSSPVTATGRPSILPRPITALAGVRSTRSLAWSYSALPAMLPSSRKESLSSSRSMRSRTVSRPPSCWRFTLSAPPMRFVISWRRRSSSISGCQLILSFPGTVVSIQIGLVSYQCRPRPATANGADTRSRADGRNGKRRPMLRLSRRVFEDDAVDQVFFVEPREVDAAGRAGDLEIGNGALDPCLLIAAEFFRLFHGDGLEPHRLARQQAAE